MAGHVDALQDDRDDEHDHRDPGHGQRRPDHDVGDRLLRQPRAERVGDPARRPFTRARYTVQWEPPAESATGDLGQPDRNGDGHDRQGDQGANERSQAFGNRP
jgi:hypothetical protein